MIRLILVLSAVLCLSMRADEELPFQVTSEHYEQADLFRLEIEQGRVREKSNVAFNVMFRIAVFHLRLKGKKAEADKIEAEWENHWNGYLMRVKDIGDFAPLSKWVSETYLKIEGILGQEICDWIRISDIYSLNHELPFAFSPCKINGVEFYKHMVGDKRRGLYPILAYWSAYVSTTAATMGGGFIFLSGMVGAGCEFVVKRWIAPPLAEKIWNWACQ